MPEPNAAAAVAREWVTKAENDLRAAQYLLEPRAERPTDAICFHSQQCTEKYIKAALVLQGVDLPKTHDIERLCALLPVALRPRLTAEEKRRLTGYAIAARYPGSGEISYAEARRAVAIARRFRTEIRRGFPRQVLRRKSG